MDDNLAGEFVARFYPLLLEYQIREHDHFELALDQTELKLRISLGLPVLLAAVEWLQEGKSENYTAQAFE